MQTLRFRSVAWFAAGALLTLIASLMFAQAWRVDAAPGDSDSTVVAVNPPVRILDTRDGTDVGLAGPFVSTVAQKLQVAGSIPTTAGPQIVVPDGSTGVLLNVTAVRPTGDGFVSVRPGDASGAPATSNLNVTAGSNTPNAVTVALPVGGSNAGQVDLTYVSGTTTDATTDVLVDVVGYLTDDSLDEIAARLDAIETDVTAINDGPTVARFDAQATATEGANASVALDAAPQIPLGTIEDITFYGKCSKDLVNDATIATIFAATATDGAVLLSDARLPDNTGADYLDVSTVETRREVVRESAGAGSVDARYEVGFVIQPDGSRISFTAEVVAKGDGVPAGDGPLGPGDTCTFGLTTTS